MTDSKSNAGNKTEQKQKGKANLIAPELFLFSGYMVKEKLVRKNISPIQNQLLYVGKKGEKASNPNNTPVLKTDEKGMIFHFNGKEKTNFAKRTPFRGGNIKGFSPVNEIEALIPPADMVCRSAFSNDNWLSDFNDKMQEKIKSDTNIEIPKLKLTSVKRSELRQPQNTESDKEYRQWYNTINGNDIYGYIMPKTRAIFLVFNLDIVDGANTSIKVWKADGKAIIIKADEIKTAKYDNPENKSVLHIATLTGTDSDLPKGTYKIEVRLPKNSSDNKHWNSRSAGNSKLNIQGTDSYTLSFNIKFDIQNIAGEFSIVNADPISLEEALIKQYPQYYNYLLTDKLLETNPELQKNEAGDGSNTQPKSKGHVLTPMLNMWNTSKDIAGLANKTINTKSPSEFLKMLTHTIHDKYKQNENQKLRQAIDLVYQTKSTVDAWNDLRGSMEDLLKQVYGVKSIDEKISTINLAKILYSKDSSIRKSASSAILGKKLEEYASLRNEKAWKAWIANPDNLDPDYKLKLGSALDISEKTMKFIGKSLDVIDIATGLLSVADSCFSLGLAHNELETSKKTLNDFTEEYLHFLGKKTTAKETEIEIRFAGNSADLSLTAIDQLTKEALPLLKDNKNQISIFGYTDTVGTLQENQKLAKDRANALKDWIVKEAKIDASQIHTLAFGEHDPKIPNPKDTLEFSCAENRRCVVFITNQIRKENTAPCRHAIDTLEKNRYITVTQHMKVAEAIVDLLEKAADFALAVASIIPITAPAAMAISLAKEATNLAKSIDSFCFNDALQKFAAGNKISTDLLFDSYSNQTLIRDLYNDTKEKNSISDTSLSNIQLRLRAEAISGFLRLVVRASLAGKDKFEKKLFEDYKIEAYIKNFILNDGWNMPLHPPIAISMDEFWLFAVNKHNKDSEKAVENFGLDENYGLINAKKIIDMLPPGSIISIGAEYIELARQYEESGFQAKGVIINQMYMMSITDKVPYHVKSSFQDDYPIHHIATKEYTKLVNDINPDFSGLSTKIYEHMAIYFMDKDGKWKSLAAHELEQYKKDKENLKNPVVYKNSIDLNVDDQFGFWTTMANSYMSSGISRFMFSNQKRLYSMSSISPTTPIKIIIAFKNKSDDDEEIVDGITPVSVQLHRYDNFMDIDGPKYKTIARRLMPKDFDGLPDISDDHIETLTGIRNNKQISEGMYGCVIEPFFQLGLITRAGIKPCADISSSYDLKKQIENSDFKDMKYGFTCVVGSNESTKIKVPFHTKKYWDSSIKSVDSFDDEITVSLDNNDIEQKKLLNKSFLNNNATNKTTYPEFFTGNIKATSFIRIEGDKSQFIPSQPYLNDVNELTNQSLKGLIIEKERYTALPLMDEHYRLSIKNFDWNTPVDFAITLACSKPMFDEYNGLKQIPDSIKASSSLINSGDAISNVTGTPLDKMPLRLLGRVTGVLMPGIPDNEIGQQFIDIAKKLTIEIEEGKKSTSSLSAAEKSALDEYNKKAKGSHKVIFYNFTPMANKITQESAEILKYLSSPHKKFSANKKLRLHMNGASFDSVQTMISPYKHLDQILPSGYLSAYDTNDSYYIFAASKSMSYEHPLTGEKINSIRPFGETDGIGEKFYEYRLKELRTSGNSAGGKPIDINKSIFRFSAKNAISALKPGAKFLNDPNWKEKHPDWEQEIKDWIEKEPTRTNGPQTLFKEE